MPKRQATAMLRLYATAMGLSVSQILTILWRWASIALSTLLVMPSVALAGCSLFPADIATVTPAVRLSGKMLNYRLEPGDP